MSEKILGIELCSDYLAAVVISKSFNHCTVTDAHWVSSLSNAPSDSKEDSDNKISLYGWKWDAQSLELAFSDIVSKLDLRGCSTSALSIPAYLVAFRNLTVPFASDKKIRQILPFELNSHLPTGQAGYISDFHLLKNMPIRDRMDNLSESKENHIFTASIPINIVDICFSILKNHRIQPELVTSQGLMIPLCIAHSKTSQIGFENKIDEITVFIETRNSDTVISFIYNDNIIAVRSFHGRKNFEFIEKTIHQTIIGLHHRYDIATTPSIYYHISDVKGEFKSSESELDHAIHTIYIADIINYKNINHRNSDEIAKKILSILRKGKKQQGVSNMNLSERNLIDKSDESDKLVDARWFNAVAAAICYANSKPVINFCQGEYAKNSFFLKFKENLALLSSFIIVTVALLFINIEYDIIQLDKQVKTLDKAVEDVFTRTFPDVKNVVEPLMQMQVKLKEAETQSAFGSGKIGTLSQNNISSVEILYEISNRIPDSVDVEVSRFLLSEGKVVMAGTTDNFNTVDKIKTMLEKYNRFKSVTISNASADKSGKRISFNFIIDLK